jgi:hypothetical protein
MTRKGFAFAGALQLVALLSLHVPSPALAAFSAAELKCRDTIAKLGTKLSQTAAKAFNDCHAKRIAGTVAQGTACNSVVDADLTGKIAKAEAKLLEQVPAKCPGLTPASLNYDACPAACAAEVPSIANFNHVAACVACVAQASVEGMTGSAQGNPALPIGDVEANCHDTLGDGQTKHFRAILKERRKCQKSAEKVGAMSTASCKTADPNGKIATARSKSEGAVDADCSSALLADLDSCAQNTLPFLKGCVFGTSDLTGTQVFNSFYELTAGGGVTTTTFGGSTTSSTTTTTMGGGGSQDPQCPNKSELVIWASTTGVSCANNGDCPVGTCDTNLGRCTTVSELDTGWTGISHDADIVDQAVTVADILCPGPAPACGDCTVLGVNPEPRNCRCATDNRQVCDQPFVSDANDCGGDVCNCYFGVPLPLSAGNTPACVVNRFRQDLSGTVNVDTGAGETQVRLASVVYLGISTIEPCPSCGGTCTAPPANVGVVCGVGLDCDTNLGDGDGVCGNLDPTPDDGVRGGTCRGGANNGQSCDAGARHESFPAPGGSTNSLDCFPSPGLNVSGTGLRIDLDQGTGSQSLSVGITCGFPPFFVDQCHCGQCSGSVSIPCNNDSPCTAAGAGTCVRAGNNDPLANQCAGNGKCNDAGGGEGVCDLGPTDKFCDGLLRANGEGFLACQTQADCDAFPGGVAGLCTLSKGRECFLDTIVANGVADPELPVGVATFCIAKTSNAGINAVAGLPGPARVVNQSSVTHYCASNPAIAYTPGVGGCPP